LFKPQLGFIKGPPPQKGVDFFCVHGYNIFVYPYTGKGLFMTQKKKTTRKSAAKKTTASKAKKPSGKKLDQMNITNGKTYSQEKSVEIVRKLESLLDVSQTNPFGTSDARVFEENLASMNLSDMQEVAVRAGVFPSGNQTILKQKLLKAFRAEGYGTVNSVVEGANQVTLDPSNPKHKEIIDYLKG
jgi:hypothetical protein